MKFLFHMASRSQFIFLRRANIGNTIKTNLKIQNLDIDTILN